MLKQNGNPICVHEKLQWQLRDCCKKTVHSHVIDVSRKQVTRSDKGVIFHNRKVWFARIWKENTNVNEDWGNKWNYLSRLLIGISVSKLCNGTSYHLSRIGLHKQMGAIQNVYYEFLRRRQRIVHVDYELCHWYVTAKKKIRSKRLSDQNQREEEFEGQNKAAPLKIASHISKPNYSIKKKDLINFEHSDSHHVWLNFHSSSAATWFRCDLRFENDVLRQNSPFRTRIVHNHNPTGQTNSYPHIYLWSGTLADDT